MEWLARDLLQVSTGEALKFLNDEYLEIRDRYSGEFALMANAHALEESCRPIVEEMIGQGGAKAIAVASSYGDGSERAFLDSPKAEWLWEFAAANGIVVHIHPPMLSVGHEVLMQYRLNEAVGRPFDSTVNGARMIGSGVFDRQPKLQVLIVHMGGELASVLGPLEFTWQLNYKGVRNPPAGRPYTNKRPPSDYFKINILVDSMGFNPIGLRAAVEMCGVDRVVFGSDYGPIPYGIEEHVPDRRGRASEPGRAPTDVLEDKQQSIPPGPSRYRSHHRLSLPSKDWFSAAFEDAPPTSLSGPTDEPGKRHRRPFHTHRWTVYLFSRAT